MNLGRAIADPAKFAREERVSATVLLFAALVAIQVFRRGRLPDQRGLIAVLVAAFAVAMAASIGGGAGELVFYVLLIGIVISMVNNVDILADLMGQGERRFREALAVAA